VTLTPARVDRDDRDVDAGMVDRGGNDVGFWFGGYGGGG